MASEILSKMALQKWLIIAAVIFVAVIFSLFQFTSFQIPKSVTQGTPEPQVDQGIQPGVSTVTCNNLDRVYNQIHNKPECGSEGDTEGDKTDE